MQRPIAGAAAASAGDMLQAIEFAEFVQGRRDGFRRGGRLRSIGTKHACIFQFRAGRSGTLTIAPHDRQLRSRSGAGERSSTMASLDANPNCP